MIPLLRCWRSMARGIGFEPPSLQYLWVWTSISSILFDLDIIGKICAGTKLPDSTPW